MYLLSLDIIITILLVKLTAIGCTNTSTVCYGSPGPSCLTHRLSCPSPLVIQIINTIYGYRPGCNNIGLTVCSNITCCKEEPDDCFIPFSSDENQQVLRNCSGVQSCKSLKFRRYNTTHTVCNGRIVSAYSKIQYICVKKGSSSRTPPSHITYSQTTNIVSTVTTSTAPTTIGLQFNKTEVGETSKVGSIVGGIFGVIIIIVIIIIVVVFLYKRRKKSPSKTFNSSKDISGYDEIELDTKPKVQATATHLNSNITHNRKTKIQTTDNYDHVGDEKLKVNSPKELDNYNHVGTHDHSVHEDNYNHIGNNPSVSSNHLESDYNHFNGVFETDEDDYNHFGNNDNNNVITDDNYHHIGTGNIKVEGDYDHIGSESHDNHIHDDNNHVYNDNDSPYNLATC